MSAISTRGPALPRAVVALAVACSGPPAGARGALWSARARPPAGRRRDDRADPATAPRGRPRGGRHGARGGRRRRLPGRPCGLRPAPVRAYPGGVRARCGSAGRADRPLQRAEAAAPARAAVGRARPGRPGRSRGRGDRALRRGQRRRPDLRRAPAVLAGDRPVPGRQRDRDQVPGARRARLRGRARPDQGRHRARRRDLRGRSGRRGLDDHLLRAHGELAGAAGNPHGRRRLHAAGAAAGLGAGQPAAAGARADAVVQALVLDRRRARDPAGRAAGRAHARPPDRGDRGSAAGRGGLDAVAAAAPGRFAGREARRLARADQGRGERPGPLPVRRAAQRDGRDPAPADHRPGAGRPVEGDSPARSRARERAQLHPRRRLLVVDEARHPGPARLSGGGRERAGDELAGLAAQQRPAVLGRRPGRPVRSCSPSRSSRRSARSRAWTRASRRCSGRSAA